MAVAVVLVLRMRVGMRHALVRVLMRVCGVATRMRMRVMPIAMRVLVNVRDRSMRVRMRMIAHAVPSVV